jgi:multiple sugar transport system permease protein
MVNYYLGKLGLPDDIAWTTSVPAAWFALVGVTVWWTLGFNAVIYLAGLQDIPKELYEAAEVDGATRWQRLRNVTVPGVRPATTLVVILATITGANLFTEPYLLTNGGGPDGASASPVLVMYQKCIQQGNPDVASAIGVILVVAVLVISLVNRRLLERD